MFDKGHGVEQDYAQAFKWFSKAAEQGDADVQNNLGIIFDQGRGVKRDPTQALQWYRKAAEQRQQADAQHAIDVFVAVKM